MPTLPRPLALAVALLSLTAASVACTSGGAERPSTSASRANPGQAAQASEVATDRVEIRDFLFAPEGVSVAVGTTVTWTNRDSFAHSVVADDRSYRSDDLGQEGVYTHTFDTAGTFSYYCGIHNYMTGRVVVR